MAKQPKAAPAPSIASEIAALKAIGMPDDEIRATLLGSRGTAGVQAQPVQLVPAANAQERQDKRINGPDPELVARLERFNATYVPAVLEVTFEVTLPKRMADYVSQWAEVESYRRKGADIPPAKAIELIVRRYWQNDPDRQLMARGGTAPAALPPATWAQKSA